MLERVVGHIDKVRAPFAEKLSETLAVSQGLLYRRGNFSGTWDQLIVDALMEVKGADLASSPGFRWGTSLLPGQKITRELMMDQLAITYPYATLTEMTGETLKTILEDVADNLFNPDPYYQQGGDMVRVGGLQYTCAPGEKAGARISDMRLKGQPIEAGKTRDVVEKYLRGQKVIKAPVLDQPKLVGVEGNAGMARL